MKLGENHLPAQRCARKFRKRLTMVATNAGYASSLSIAGVRSGIAIVVGGSITTSALSTAFMGVDVEKGRFRLLIFGRSGSARPVGTTMMVIPFRYAVSLGHWQPRRVLTNASFMSKGVRDVLGPWMRIRACHLIRAGSVVWGFYHASMSAARSVIRDHAKNANCVNETFQGLVSQSGVTPQAIPWS